MKLGTTEIKDIVQDCNINFLLGSGMSMSYLSTLEKNEQFLEDGTTTFVAKKHSHKWIGIEQDKGYVEIAKKRMK